jgi:hypothetical protein
VQILKFVLWTWPSATASVDGFRDSRVEFHRVMARHKVDGFLGSGMFSVDTAPWAGAFLFENSPWSTGHRTVFEEWYLFHGSAALDAINERVHEGPYKESHGKFLRQDLGGECAGLYYARKGAVEQALDGLTRPRTTLWFNKTSGTYDALLDRLGPAMGASRCVLWRRLLVLGPTPEFHVDVDADTALPEDLRPFRVRRTRLFPA